MTIKTKRHMNVALTVKSVSDSGEFEGYGSVFGVKDSHSDIVIKGAFTKSLARWAERGRLPAMLWQHKTDEPIGVYTEMREDDHGLYVKGRLLIEDDALARRAHAHMKAGSLDGLSIGFMLNDSEYDRTKGAEILKEIDLWEVSPVTFASNQDARIESVKSILEGGDTPSPSLVEKVLREVGFSRSQSKAFMAKGYSAIAPRDAEVDDALDSIKSLFQQIEV